MHLNPEECIFGHGIAHSLALNRIMRAHHGPTRGGGGPSKARPGQWGLRVSSIFQMKNKGLVCFRGGLATVGGLI